MRRGRREIGAPVAAGREHDRVAAEAVDRSVLEAQSDHTAARAVFHDQIEREIFDVEIGVVFRSEEHTSELQSLMRISYAVFCLKKKITNKTTDQPTYTQSI